MKKSLALLFNDMWEAFNTLNVEDLTMPLGFLLWTIILIMPLWRIDRRDVSSAATYILFCMAVGVALVFALPKSFTEQPLLKTQIIMTVIMACAAGLRWTIRLDRIFAREVRTQKSFAEEDEEFGRRNASDPAKDARRSNKATG